MAGHLLLVGSHLDSLVDLCVGLEQYFLTTTIASTARIGSRTDRAIREGFEAIVVHLGKDDTDEYQVEILRQHAPNVLFVASVPDSPTCSLIRSRGGLVLSTGEPRAILHASLFALAGRGTPMSKTSG